MNRWKQATDSRRQMTDDVDVWNLYHMNRWRKK